MMLFAARVAAQLLQYVRPVDYLPAFEAWHSATVPYPLLLLSQVLILLAQAWSIREVARGAAWSRRAGWMLLAFGAVYLLSMIGRMAIGITDLSGSTWFDAYLPAAFHMVLAIFVLAIAHLILRLDADGARQG